MSDRPTGCTAFLESIRRRENLKTLNRIAARANGGEIKMRDARIKELEETLERIHALAAVKSNGSEVGRLGKIREIAASKLCPFHSE
jgi:hypothetical protein